jgi:Zn-finger protein
MTGLSVHHVFAGVANRPISEKYGLKVWLCHECHTGNEGAQYDKMKNLQLKQDAQYAFEREHTRSDWMKLIGKNYL